MFRVALAILLTAGVAEVAHAQANAEVVPGSYIALYSGNSEAAARIAEREGGVVAFNHAGAGILIVRSAPRHFATRLSRAAAFTHVFEDRWIAPRRSPLGTPNGLDADPSGGSVSVLSSPFNALLLPLQWNILKTSTPDAWAMTQGDPSVRVAIVDTGICTHHKDLIGKVDVARSISFVPAAEEPDTLEPACVGCPAWEDRHGHGTWVASIVSTNNYGIAGVAPNVQLIAVKVGNHDDRGTISTLIRGVVYAADVGSDVINVSRTYDVNPIPEFPRGMALLQKMFAYAARQGSLLVFGAGNEGIDLDHAGNAIEVPAESTNGVVVGATTVSDARATYSNHGVSGVTMMAPGGGLPTDPFPETLLNRYVLAACSVHGVNRSCGTTTYDFVEGTSFAAPMVAGAAALVISSDARFKGRPQQVKAQLVQTADDLGDPGTDNVYSKGRLNVLRAVQQAVGATISQTINR